MFSGNFAYHPNEDAAIFSVERSLAPIATSSARNAPANRGQQPRLEPAETSAAVFGRGSDRIVPDLRQHLLEAGRCCGAHTTRRCRLALQSARSHGLRDANSYISHGDRPTGTSRSRYLVAGSVSEYVQTIRTVLENQGLAKSLSENGRRAGGRELQLGENHAEAGIALRRTAAAASGIGKPCASELMHTSLPTSFVGSQVCGATCVGAHDGWRNPRVCYLR